MEYSVLLESNAWLLEEYFLTCGRQLVPSYTASNSPRRITTWKDKVHYTGVGGEMTLWEASQWGWLCCTLGRVLVQWLGSVYD
jgi:hypothetical protein